MRADLIKARIRTNLATGTLKLMANKSWLRSIALKIAVDRTRKSLKDYEMTEGSKSEYLAAVEAQYVINLMNLGIRNLDRGFISKEYLKKWLRRWDAVSGVNQAEASKQLKNIEKNME